jgi:hypothetical protein
MAWISQDQGINPAFLSVPFGSQNPSTVFCRDRLGVAAYQVGHAGALERLR